MPARASTRSSCLAFIRVRARAASACGSRSPAISALIMSSPDSVVSLLATEDSLIRRLPAVPRAAAAAVPLLGQPGARPGVVAGPGSPRAARSGPQQPHLGQPGQPHRIQLVGLGRPGRFLARAALTSCTASPAASRTKTRYASSPRWTPASRSGCRLASAGGPARRSRPSSPSPSRRRFAGRRAGTGAASGRIPSRSPWPRLTAATRSIGLAGSARRRSPAGPILPVIRSHSSCACPDG